MKTILGIIAIAALGVVAISELTHGTRFIIALLKKDYKTMDKLLKMEEPYEYQ